MPPMPTLAGIMCSGRRSSVCWPSACMSSQSGCKRTLLSLVEGTHPLLVLSKRAACSLSADLRVDQHVPGCGRLFCGLRQQRQQLLLHMADLLEQAKRLASFRAIDEQVSPSTHIIGIGSGSTIVYAVERLAERVKTDPSLSIKACIPTSFQAQNLILEAGLPLGTLNQYPSIDVAFDGADEVDASLHCIKGGGACHLQEKLVASNAARFFLVADYRKNSSVLGTQWKQGVPLEVIPSVYIPVMNKIKAMGGNPVLRMAVKKAGPVVTDNGNFVVDADFGQIADPVALNTRLLDVPGIVETGLFCGMANGAYFGMPDGTVKSI
ncbi:ribose 5-phosphate isomerase A-domain-containing protein [Entophlyctis helioformis]|nr:ribose 5-phosphate isomerase A-domain-containing protein [Entophlyctis helioformis]